MYICMGKHIEKDKINTIKNIIYFTKPNGGLWLSSFIKDDMYLCDWQRWCDENNFHKGDSTHYSMIKLCETARILSLSTKDDIAHLPTICGIGSFVCLDFEKLAECYDAIHLTYTGLQNLYYDLYGWDCESLLILNKDCIQSIKHKCITDKIEAYNCMDCGYAQYIGEGDIVCTKDIPELIFDSWVPTDKYLWCIKDKI